METKAWAIAHPSLALIKYWGKQDTQLNLPATTSLAVSLNELSSKVEVCLSDRDRVILDGKEQAPERYSLFLDNIRSVLKTDHHYDIMALNDFPGSAGLASSSSGFAALTAACAALSGQEVLPPDLSSMARLGSASAARSIFGGFTLLPAGSSAARPLYDHHYWPELRVLICLVDEGPKMLSSRSAMERSRNTSPYYDAWIKDAQTVSDEAVRALEQKDLERLGSLMRLSYQRMFATMFSADPPIIYWKPGSLALIHLAQELRTQGIGIWETMDAGPQVKYFCLDQDTKRIKALIEARFPEMKVLVSRPGPGVSYGTGKLSL